MSRRTGRRTVERIVTWGGAAVVVFVAGSLGVHPAGAVVLGVAGALVIAGLLSVGGPT